MRANDDQFQFTFPQADKTSVASNRLELADNFAFASSRSPPSSRHHHRDRQRLADRAERGRNIFAAVLYQVQVDVGASTRLSGPNNIGAEGLQAKGSPGSWAMFRLAKCCVGWAIGSWTLPPPCLSIPKSVGC